MARNLLFPPRDKRDHSHSGQRLQVGAASEECRLRSIMSTRPKVRVQEHMDLQGVFASLHKNGGILLQIRVHSSAFRSCITGKLADGSLKVDIAAPPEDGKANAELVRFLAKELGVPKVDIEITSGLMSRRKVVRVHR
jgi:uncharacterized protein (TIGR00251 family)